MSEKCRIYIRVYEERVANAVETFLSQLYREPWSHSEEMIPHTRWEALRDTVDNLQEELDQLWWSTVTVLIEEWKP